MNENSDMTCAELTDVAAELALGVLTGRERALAVAHLDNCDICREDVRQLMATGEQLLELLPPAEPSAGFETRVLERLGLPMPAPEPTWSRRGHAPWLTGPAHGQSRPSGDRPGSGRPRGDRPSGGQHSGRRRPGRLRRALAATAVGVAVIAAGLGGWRIGVGTAPAATGPLSSASLLTASHQDVGDIFLYSGDSPWLFMSVDMGSGGDIPVTCQLVGDNGQVTTVGTFRLADGYGSWGSPDPGTVTPLRGARLVTANGTVLATATFNQ
ncbi:MAG TPA: hypothetical protein VN714_05060 [Trebonia sp.]|jgi:hypothetical protein|nr:hypothetical protein [Trebonia sp.]